MKVIIYPNPFLRKKTKRVKKSEILKLQSLISEMIKIMKEKNGVGLAAPQIGKSLKIIVIAADDKGGILALINPKILKKSFRKEIGEEGCLSFPGIYGLVKRAKKIKVAAINQEGKKIKFFATNFFARVILHEVDHLNGILFIDRAKKIIKGEEELEKLT